MSAYINRKTGSDDLAAELGGQLTEFEKKLVESQDVVEIRGKVCYIGFKTHVVIYFCYHGYVILLYYYTCIPIRKGLVYFKWKFFSQIEYGINSQILANSVH